MSKTIALSVIDNDFYSFDRTFLVRLSNASGGTIGTLSQERVGLFNNDARPTIVMKNYQFVEGNGGAHDALLNFELVGKTKVRAAMGFQLRQAVGKRSPEDLVMPINVGFDPGETTKTAIAKVTGDTWYEGDETRFVRFTTLDAEFSADQPRLSGDPYLLIVDDDAMPAVTANDVNVVEGVASGNVTITFHTDVPAYGTFTAVTTADTADADFHGVVGPDYYAKSETVAFNGGTTATMTVNIANDPLTEPDQSFYIDLSNARTLQLTRTRIKVTILNDDFGTPTLSPSSFDANVGQTIDFRITFNSSHPADAIYANFQAVTNSSGTAVVTATVPPSLGGVTPTSTVHVQHTMQLSFTPSLLRMTPGSTANVSVVLSPSQPQPVTITLSVADRNVATAPATVVVPAFSTARFTVTARGVGHSSVVGTANLGDIGAASSSNIEVSPKLNVTLQPATGSETCSVSFGDMVAQAS
jgi:hypothetical protein